MGQILSQGLVWADFSCCLKVIQIKTYHVMGRRITILLAPDIHGSFHSEVMYNHNGEKAVGTKGGDTLLTTFLWSFQLHLLVFISRRHLLSCHRPSQMVLYGMEMVTTVSVQRWSLVLAVNVLFDLSLVIH